MTTRDIFKKGSTTFFYASLFFPAAVKADVFTLYAYVRIIDDLVDQEQPDKKALNTWWRQTLKAWRGQTTANPIIDNFVELAKRKHFNWQWIEAFWWAMRQDLHKKHYATFRELEKYMYGSAEVIGLMMARILSLPKEAESAARLQGKAMQLINFIRDIQEDIQLGRNYVAGLGVTTTSPQHWSKIITKQIARYQHLQRQAEAGYRYLPFRYLVPIKTAAHMYNWTAQQILSQPELVWQKKIKPSRARVILTAVKNSVI